MSSASILLCMFVGTLMTHVLVSGNTSNLIYLEMCFVYTCNIYLIYFRFHTTYLLTLYFRTKEKLLARSKQRDCSDIQPWIKSMTNHVSDIQPWIKSMRNHVYWAAMTSEGESDEMIMAKWNSLANHVINKHDNHHPLFPQCLHGTIDVSARRKKWLKPCTCNPCPLISRPIRFQ